jgi:hypothetical protein
MVRAFADGLVSVLLPAYPDGLGLSAEIGGVVTATLRLAALTLALGLRRTRPRTLLLAARAHVRTGIAFASVHALLPLVAIAFVAR